MQTHFLFQLLWIITAWSSLQVVFGSPIISPRDDGFGNLASDEKLIAAFDLGNNERLAYLGKVGVGSFAYATAVQAFPDSRGDTAQSCAPICVRKSNKDTAELAVRFSRMVALGQIPGPDVQLVNESRIMRYIAYQMDGQKRSAWKPKMAQLIREDGPYDLKQTTPVHVAYISYLNGQTAFELQHRLQGKKLTRSLKRDVARLLVRILLELLGTVLWLSELPMPITNTDIHLKNVLFDWQVGAAFPDAYSIDFGVAKQVSRAADVDTEALRAAVLRILISVDDLYPEAGLTWNQGKLIWEWKSLWPKPSAHKALQVVSKMRTSGVLNTVEGTEGWRKMIYEMMKELNKANVNEPSSAATLSYKNLYVPEVMPQMLRKVNWLSPRLFDNRQGLISANIAGPWVPMKVKVGKDGKADMTKVAALDKEVWCHLGQCHEGKV